MAVFSLESEAFEDGKAIPKKYTCDGENISPPLEIKGIPKGTKSFALIMDDPDAPMGKFTHWVIWNIPAHRTKIVEGEETDYPHGKTNFNKIGYGGPCPPIGEHRYFFRVYALDCYLDIHEGSDRKVLEGEMVGHVIDECSLMGRYKRK